MTIDLDELERIGNAATAAPWEDCFSIIGPDYNDPNRTEKFMEWMDNGKWGRYEQDKLLIITARNNWQAMIDEIRRLRAENAELLDAITDIEADYNLNEGAEGEPITSGHKRCVDRAVEALAAIRLRK